MCVHVRMCVCETVYMYVFVCVCVYVCVCERERGGERLCVYVICLYVSSQTGNCLALVSFSCLSQGT